ncbi:MAG: hypothetical protein IIX99_04230 [Oscillospiraceae bacterium]|nr:hypothetical protein [Oscillospiraceae bacterium]
MDEIKFANGETHECSHLTTHDGKAHIALADVTFAAAAALFSDAEKTSVMEWGDYRLVGYTNCIMLTVQPYGIQATLTGGHDEHKEANAE